MPLARARAARRAVAFLVLAWGSNFVPVVVCLQYLPPIALAGWRTTAGGLLLGGLALAWHRQLGLRQAWRTYLLLAILNVVGFQTLQALALASGPSGLVAVLIYLQPLLATVLARVVLGERWNRRRLWAMVSALAGVALAVGAGDRRTATATATCLAVAAATFWAGGTVMLRKSVRKVDPVWAVALPLLAGGVALLSLSMAVEDGSTSVPPGRGIAAFAWVVLVGTVLSWLVWVRLLARSQVVVVTAKIYLVPVVAVLLGAVLLHEQLTILQGVGIFVVVSAVRAVTRGEHLEHTPQGVLGRSPDVEARQPPRDDAWLAGVRPSLRWLR